MTDARVGEADLLRAIRRLPRGSAVIVRHYHLGDGARRVLFDRVKRAARRRGVQVLLAGAAQQARRWGADGHHGQTGGGQRAGGGSHRGWMPKGWIHSAQVHDRREIRAAQRAGADVLLLSPLFATRSHPGARPLGGARFAALARSADRPVMALGGVGRRHAALVRALGATGYAAIDGLVRYSG